MSWLTAPARKLNRATWSVMMKAINLNYKHRKDEDRRYWWHDRDTVLVDGDEALTQREAGHKESGMHTTSIIMLVFMLVGAFVALELLHVLGVPEAALVPLKYGAQGLYLWTLAGWAKIGVDDVKVQQAAEPLSEDAAEAYVTGEIDEAELEQELETDLEVER